MCPTAQSLVGQVDLAAREAPHVKDATVELVWEPPWTMDSMSEEARLLLGF
jgi:metal-sulfur cluster biosynthetic enzyme